MTASLHDTGIATKRRLNHVAMFDGVENGVMM